MTSLASYRLEIDAIKGPTKRFYPNHQLHSSHVKSVTQDFINPYLLFSRTNTQRKRPYVVIHHTNAVYRYPLRFYPATVSICNRSMKRTTLMDLDRNLPLASTIFRQATYATTYQKTKIDFPTTPTWTSLCFYYFYYYF